MRLLALTKLAFAATVSVVTASASGALGQNVDIELVLAVDVSSSVDNGEQILQRRGYVAAFRDPQVIAAITSGSFGSIAVTYVEWAGEHHKVVIPWRVIQSESDARAFASELASKPISRADLTSISGGLLFAADQFVESPASGLRRTIDISGDGANNSGPPVASTRDALVAQGITINGLPIMIRPSQITWPIGSVDLGLYYEDCVIGGSGAFTVKVEDQSGFQLAIRQKLFLEIAGIAPPVILAADDVQPRPLTDCLVGEHWFSEKHGG
jgi:Protein of unknown function (DUF1194)